jgi:hypothetical protein
MNERNKEESMVDMASRELVARRSVWPAYDIWSTRTSSDHGLFHIFALCPLLISESNVALCLSLRACFAQSAQPPPVVILSIMALKDLRREYVLWGKQGEAD